MDINILNPCLNTGFNPLQLLFLLKHKLSSLTSGSLFKLAHDLFQAYLHISHSDLGSTISPGSPGFFQWEMI